MSQLRTLTTASLALLSFAAPFASAQALSGKRVVLSPGHGYYWHSSLGWTTQRPLIDELIEDIHTNEIVMDHLIPYLEGAGAQVITCRARTRTVDERIVDNDGGPPAYTESGSWFTSASAGFGGGTYRYASNSPAGSARATFEAAIPFGAEYPVYLWYRAGTNRGTDVRVEIEHAGGTSVRQLDQSRDGERWVHVGNFPFHAGAVARVHLVASGSGGVVVADAMRVGDGMGSIVRGGTRSGRPRWLECSRYHAEYYGAPASVWNSISGGEDNSDDVTCRPRFAEWWGADLFLSLHTNAGGGSGTSSYIHDTAPSPGSAAFQTELHARVMADLRASWDPSWVDRGRNTANFGEMRLLSTMPGCLLELAFHDDVGGDTEAIHHPEFRRIAARAMYRAIHSYLAPGTPWVLDPPLQLLFANDGAGGLGLRWNAVAGASAYRVQLSADGFGWDDGRVVTTTHFDLPALLHGTVRYARVAAVNAGGTGPNSVPVGARVAPGGRASLLLVDGFDRRDRHVKELENPRAWLPVHGGAATAIASAGYAFDGCTNDAVESALAALAPYRCVGWILGEESTQDETFSALEQSRVAFYLASGGRLFFSGAEVGWDLDWRGSASDRAFYENVLGHDYVADDAGVYRTGAQSSGVLGALPSIAFDDGTNGIYDVDYPDVVRASTTGGGSVVLWYSNGLGAAVLRGDGRVLGLGFPLEAIVDPAQRSLLAERILERMCPLGFDPQGSFVPGQPLPITIDLPSGAGALYVAGASLGNQPGLPLADGRWIPLNADPLFQLSLAPNSPVFQGNVGVLDGSGRAQMTLLVPADPLLRGFEWSMAAFALNPATGAIPAISSWRSFRIP